MGLLHFSFAPRWTLALHHLFISILSQPLTVSQSFLLRLKKELKQTSNYFPLVILRNCQIRSLKLTLWLLPFISCPRDLCWLFVACFDVFPCPPSLCSHSSGECKSCSEGFGLQCVNSSLSPSLCFCPVKPGMIGHLFTKMGSKRIPCYRRIPECSNGEWCSTACLMGNKQMEPVSSNMKTLERH